MDEDRVLAGTADGRLYRVVAGDAFSWSALLIEDQLGERFVLDTVTRGLTPITEQHSVNLIESRAYRPWNGPQRWSPVGEISPAPHHVPRQLEIPVDLDATVDGATT